MKKLQRYVLGEVLKGLVPAFLALSFIMVLGFCVQLLHEGLDVVRLPGLVPAVLMYSVPLVLPAAFLTAVLIGFGRLAADNELLAIRVGGVNLTSAILPVCLLGLFLSGIATVFQFEIVPFARRRIELLKYKAIKQILINKVALSSKRQFSFGPYHIQYDDYRDGKMIHLLFLEARGGRPQRMVRADEGKVLPDPENEACARFKFEKCILTGFGDDEIIGGGVNANTECDSFTYTQQVIPRMEHIKRDVKHMRTRALLNHLRSLEAKVRQHPKTLADPEQVADRLGEQIKEAKIARHEIRSIIGDNRQEIQKFQEQDRPKREQTLQLKTQQIGKTKEELETLKSQQIELHNKMRELQEKEEQEGSYERLRTLESKRKDVQERIRSQEEKLERLKGEKQQTARQLERERRNVEDCKEEIAELQKKEQSLTERIENLEEKQDRAEQQEKLRAVWIRIHKRLAMALSVLVFTLVGIPLGMASRHHSGMLAFGVGFAIVLFVFYPALIVGQRTAQTGIMPPGFPLWLDTGIPLWSGNAFILLIGLVLSWRAISE